MVGFALFVPTVAATLAALLAWILFTVALLPTCAAFVGISLEQSSLPHILNLQGLQMSLAV